jgi:tRNA(fMet)-specific endonuclease VapC
VFLLDTDHIGIVQRQTAPEYPRLLARLQAHDSTDFYVPIVSFHEQIVGWNAYPNRARSPEAIVRAYEMFQSILRDFSAMAVASFDIAASQHFQSLRDRKVRVGTMDLRIAAIALANDWTLLTRNTVDFARVPGLRIEDWTL